MANRLVRLDYSPSEIINQPKERSWELNSHGAEKKRRVTEANDSRAHMWDYGSCSPIITPHHASCRNVTEWLPTQEDIYQPPMQLGAAMWPSSSLYNVSTSNLHVFQAGLAPCGTPLCSSPSAAKWGWHSHRTKGALVPESTNRGKPSANMLDEWEIYWMW